MTSAWWAILPPLAAAITVLLLPGLVVLAPVRIGFVARAAISGLLGVLSIGVAGVLFGAVGMSWAPWQIAVPVLPAAAAVWWLSRRRLGAKVPGDGPGWRWMLAAGAGALLIIAVVAYGAVPSPERVSQTYDNVFHLAAIAAVLDGGEASSLTLRTLIETERSSAYYPAVWHALCASVVQLSGTTPAVAVNAAWLAVAAVVWVPGAAWLAQTLLWRYNPTTVALVAVPIATSFGAMPYALLSWGTLYPTFLASALLPAAVAVPVLAGRALRTARAGRRWRAASLGALAIGAVVCAIACAQPRVLASWAVIMTPIVVAAAVGLVRSAWRQGPGARRRAVWSLCAGGAALALAAAASFVYLVVGLDLFERPLDERLGGPQAAATQSVLDGVGQVLAQAWPTGVAGAVPIPAILLAAAVLTGIVVAARTRGLRWSVVAYAAVAVLFALAAGADDVFSKLATALWYKDRYRLAATVPVLGVVLATLGILAVTRARARWAPAAAWVVAVASAATLVFTGATASVGAVFRLPDTAATTEVVSADQIAFQRSLDDIVPEGQRVLGDPWDGSAWTQVFGDREPVFPHVNGQWDPDRLALAYRLDAIDTDPSVCAALNALDVRYVLFHPHEFGGGDPAGNHFAAVHRAVEARLFTEVATDGDSTLYRIDQCGPLP